MRVGGGSAQACGAALKSPAAEVTDGQAVDTFPLAPTLVLLILLVLSGLYSGSEAVLFSLSAAQLQRDAASRNPLRRAAARLMEHPRQTLLVILLGNTAVNVLIFVVSYVAFGSLTGLLSVPLVLVFGEVVPKTVGTTLADRLAPLSAALIQSTAAVLGPLARGLDVALVVPLSRLLFGPEHTRREPRLSAEELKMLLELSRRRGVLSWAESRYLREVIDLSGLKVRDIMVPRVEMVTFDIREPVENLRALMRRTRLTKVPVHDGSIDHVLGLIYAKVLFFERDRPLRELIQPVHFVPELISLEQLLEHFRRTRSQIAVAVDEYGGVAGLVTLEDLAEQIVGEIHDPEDAPREPEVVQLSEREFEIAGSLSIHDWVDVFGGEPADPRIATVGGLVISRLGRPARLGDVVRFANLELRVVGVRGRRITRLRVRLLEPTDAAEARA